MKREKTELLHANALMLGGKGVLILGKSGAGKSLLTLTLLERAQFMGRGGLLVADDYCEISLRLDRLIARAPEATRGAIEVRGAGLFAHPYGKEVALDLAVELVLQAERYPDSPPFIRFSRSLPCLRLPQLNSEATLTAVCHAVEAHLFWPHWPPSPDEKGG